MAQNNFHKDAEGAQSKVRVLFVCLGNICRSPMAEAVFRSTVRERGVNNVIEVNSSGTGTWNLGKPPHKGTRLVLDKAGIDYDGQIAKRFEADDITTYDYIIAMDRSNVNDMVEMGVPRERIHLFTDYVEESDVVDVPDPYYDGNFDYVYELIQKGVAGLLDEITSQSS